MWGEIQGAQTPTPDKMKNVKRKKNINNNRKQFFVYIYIVNDEMFTEQHDVINDFI